MKLLLDTCTFLWWISDAPQISPVARSLLTNPEHDVHLSAVSAWEIAVKNVLGNLPLPSPPDRFVPYERMRHEIDELSLSEAATLHVGRLPKLHRDPFDRMLVCQAIEHDMTILTPDDLVRQYPIKAIW